MSPAPREEEKRALPMPEPLNAAMRAAESYFKKSLAVGDDLERRKYAYAMGWIHGSAINHVDGELTYFVGNANGRGLIRIEVAGTGEHVASMPRGQKSEVYAKLITNRYNSHSAQQAKVEGLVRALTKAHEELVSALPFLSVKYGNRASANETLREIKAALQLAQTEEKTS